MKVTNSTSRPQRMYGVWVGPGETIQVPDDADVAEALNKGAKVKNAKIKERRK